MKTFDLQDKVAVVTGASSGLGIQFAKALGRHNSKIALVARREEKLKKVKEDLEQHGIQSNYYPTDVMEGEQVKSTVDKVVKDLGRIDILVNNAGVATVEPTEDHALENWQKVVDTNLTGVFLFTRYAGQVMIKQKHGRVINISSMYGAVGNTYMPASSYHATKGAVNTFTRAVSAEWAKYNITVNAIGPGFFLTEMTDEITEDPQFHEFVKKQCPMERMGKEGELDGALLLFASDVSSYITGQVLYVDGGWTSV
ncbi:MAG: SDR family oxidoreductase [Clostridiales bacterium]|nr:SDR family oxidoreductase [Clostridiales bacterium]MCF8022376.1 SDR family oxidoreductase [Clostridiales bacterium]